MLSLAILIANRAKTNTHKMNLRYLPRRTSTPNSGNKNSTGAVMKHHVTVTINFRRDILYSEAIVPESGHFSPLVQTDDSAPRGTLVQKELEAAGPDLKLSLVYEQTLLLVLGRLNPC
jgi:hypothetical protein